MINQFSLNDNASHKQKKYKDLIVEDLFKDSVPLRVGKIEECFQKTQNGGTSIDPDSNILYNQTARYKQKKPLVREFFRALQGLSETEMGKAASHILHVQSTVKRCWVYPKIVFTKPKSFVPSCYTMKEWTEIKKKKTTIVQELHKLVPEKKLIVDGEVAETHWRADFKAEYKFTSASMGALMREAGDDFLRSKLGEGRRDWALATNTPRVPSPTS